MSFSSDTKREIAEKREKAEHCRIAALAGIISSAGYLKDNKINIRIEKDFIQRYVEKSIKDFLRIRYKDEDNLSLEITVHDGVICVSNPLTVSRLISALKLSTEGDSFVPDRIVLQKDCCKRAFFKAVFLAAGSVTDPEKGYHLEIAFADKEMAVFLCDTLSRFEITFKIIKRRNEYVAYLKDSDDIVKCLSILSASGAMMKYENVRIYKELVNSVNRGVNCDTANLNRVAVAAANEIDDIRLIEAERGLDTLPDSLREVAELRLENPYISLKELGELIVPPIGKSGVNHRLRRIKKLADDIRNTNL